MLASRKKTYRKDEYNLAYLRLIRLNQHPSLVGYVCVKSREIRSIGLNYDLAFLILVKIPSLVNEI